MLPAHCKAGPRRDFEQRRMDPSAFRENRKNSWSFISYSPPRQRTFLWEKSIFAGRVRAGFLFTKRRFAGGIFDETGRGFSLPGWKAGRSSQLRASEEPGKEPGEGAGGRASGRSDKTD